MTINIPQKAEQILHILNEAGYEAYVVGGCVRDSILDRVPGDSGGIQPYYPKGAYYRNRGWL